MKTFLVPALSIAALALAASSLVAARTPAAISAAPAAVTYKVDPVHSAVIFSTTHLNTSRSYGRFNDIHGSITVDADKPENSKVEFQIKVESIDTGNSGRDDHLRGPDFFDVKQFPMATFASSSVKKTGDKTWSVTGSLAIHGVKKEVTIPMEHVGSGKGREGEALIGFHGTLTIDRNDFGVSYGKGMLGDKVDIVVSVEAAASK